MVSRGGQLPRLLPAGYATAPLYHFPNCAVQAAVLRGSANIFCRRKAAVVLRKVHHHHHHHHHHVISS